MRGYCIGSLVAFDKHWNFALIDVDEVYKRKRVRKAAPLICEDKLNKQLEKLKIAQIATWFRIHVIAHVSVYSYRDDKSSD